MLITVKVIPEASRGGAICHRMLHLSLLQLSVVSSIAIPYLKCSRLFSFYVAVDFLATIYACKLLKICTSKLVCG